jgi:pimeloyl-ACP methyl ester carboxylesterase
METIMKILEIVPVTVLALLLAGAVWGKLAPGDDCKTTAPKVDVQRDPGTGDRNTLYLLVPGLNSQSPVQQEYLQQVRKLLRRHGDVATITYPSHYLSNANPIAVAARINEHAQAEWAAKKYANVVVVGNSMGALLARKAMLLSAGRGAGDDDFTPTPLRVEAPWHRRVSRLIMLAGMNRGWDVSGQKPADMRWYAYATLSSLAWLGNLTHNGQLMLGMQSGSPFVADLRLEWMRWMLDKKERHPEQPGLEVIQLLGDIDDLVSPEDNEDMRVTASGNFVWLKVRGTGHRDLLDILPPDGRREPLIQQYRYAKLQAAVEQDIKKLQTQSEELPPSNDLAVTHVVFIMHGIRDLGEWSSKFETALQQQMTERARGRAEEPPKEKLAIASVRYGYFGMGQFLLRRDRQKYVNWFMDQYTETLARYPNAREIHFIGHSNGTYLLTSALEKYRSMKINRLVLGGSVVPREYDWKKVFDRGQVDQVDNYVAEDDWVVALLPRFFETWPVACLGNDIGSAGFNGFTAGDSGQLKVRNIKYITGGHDAFLDKTSDIVQFLIPTTEQMRPQSPQTTPINDFEPKRKWWPLKLYSDYLTWTVWAALIFILVWLGSRTSGAAGNFGGIALILYLIVVLQVLRWV